MMEETLKMIKEIGVGAVGMGAIIWIAMYLVKKFVDVAASQLITLVTELKVFMDKVRDEHNQSQEEHKALMEQHREISITLGRINGYKDDRHG